MKSSALLRDSVIGKAGHRAKRIVMVGGLGYENVGDEAQAGASMSRWRNCGAEVHITVLSPNPSYTHELHDVDAETAPRIVWFRADGSRHYFRSNAVFKVWFAWQYFRQTASAWCGRFGLPYLFSTREEARLLGTIASADVVHFSGGGYLTGATKSRLWENCLLMRLCRILGTPYVLTGHNIGVFRSAVDRSLAKIGFRHARYIGLRDAGVSQNELRTIGIAGAHVRNTIDDALFCDLAPSAELHQCLMDQGIDPLRGYAVLHFHTWGQSAQVTKRAESRFVELAEHLARRHELQLLMIPMVPSDEPSQARIVNQSAVPIAILRHGYRYQIAAAAFAAARMTLTFKHHPIIFSFGNAVPVVAVSLDDYYRHKNAGAMALCGQDAYCLDEEAFYGPRAFAAIDGVLADREVLSRQIRTWLDSVAGLDQEAQRLMLREWNTEAARDAGPLCTPETHEPTCR